MIEDVVRRVSCPVLVGRAAEVARLRAALERAAAGEPAVVVVAGEAGVGKTRLVAELLHDAADGGVVALTGGCLDVGDGVLAYAPLVEALRQLARVMKPGELERVLGGARAELARLVPELGGPAPGGQAAVLAPARLFELLLGVLHRLAGRGPLLLVVEDLHWADQSTRDLLGFLVRNLRGGVALVATYRSDELHRRHPLRPFLAELDRGGQAERLELGRLGRGALGELVAGVLGHEPEPGLVAEVATRSEGNPFFAEELLCAHQEGTRLPSALRDLLLARVAALPEATQRVLEVAAVAGRRVDHGLLAEVAAQPPERLVGLLREAVAHHVLVVEGGSDAYAFRHALVAEAVYDDLLPVQRGPLHAAYARALERRIEQRGGAAGATTAERGQLAYHWYAAHDVGRALLASVQAGQAAESAAALAEALGHYERALSCGSRRPRRRPAARWTASRYCTAPPRWRTTPATTTARSPWRAWRSTRSTRTPSRSAPAHCWSGSPATTGSPATLPRRWRASSGRWPPSPRSRPRRSWPARWPRTASSSCCSAAMRRCRHGASRPWPWPGRWARGPWRATP